MVPLLRDGDQSVVAFCLERQTTIRVDCHPLGRRELCGPFVAYLERVADDMEGGLFEFTSGGEELRRPSDNLPVLSLDWVDEALEL